MALGLVAPDCLTLEVRGFAAQAIVTRQCWPDELPSRTSLERTLSAVVREYETKSAAEMKAGR